MEIYIGSTFIAFMAIYAIRSQAFIFFAALASLGIGVVLSILDPRTFLPFSLTIPFACFLKFYLISELDFQVRGMNEEAQKIGTELGQMVSDYESKYGAFGDSIDSQRFNYKHASNVCEQCSQEAASDCFKGDFGGGFDKFVMGLAISGVITGIGLLYDLWHNRNRAEKSQEQRDLECEIYRASSELKQCFSEIEAKKTSKYFVLFLMFLLLGALQFGMLSLSLRKQFPPSEYLLKIKDSILQSSKKDEIKFIENALKASEGGDGHAQYAMCGYYFNIGDKENGWKFCKLSVKSGHSGALYLMGNLYYNGGIVEKNFNEAFNCYCLSAEKGYIEAQILLSHLFYQGLLCNKNFEKSLFWLEVARLSGGEIDEQLHKLLNNELSKNQVAQIVKNAQEWMKQNTAIRMELAMQKAKKSLFSKKTTNNKYDGVWLSSSGLIIVLTTLPDGKGIEIDLVQDGRYLQPCNGRWENDLEFSYSDAFSDTPLGFGKIVSLNEIKVQTSKKHNSWLRFQER